MDKKNLTIGLLLVVAAFGWMFLSHKFAPPPPAAPVPTTTTPATNPGTVSTPTTSVPAATTPGSTAAPTAAPAHSVATVEKDTAPAKIATLENEFVTVHFTDLGGAVQDVALKQYPDKLGDKTPYVFNALHADPMLAFTDFAGLDRHTRFQLVSHSATEVVYRATIFDGRVEVTRRYTLVAKPDDKHDPYVIRHETTFRNLATETVPMPRLTLNVGTAGPVNDTVYGRLVDVIVSNGHSDTTIARTKLESSRGLLGLGLGAHEATPFIAETGPVVWAATSNQFFASILTADQPGTSLVTQRVKLYPALPDTDDNAYGMTANEQFDVAPIPAHGESKLGSDLYVGPKEYHRLANTNVFKANQDKVMQFGIFNFFSKTLLSLMTWIHDLFPGTKWGWGWAILLTTLTLKLVFVPFTLAASRSARRMQKIQPELTAIREKFKDNPQKLQGATMELFKKHKVNPMGGCVPMLITLPFFWGFFQMLKSAAELRFAPFLWAADLSAPDTVGHIFSLPLNIMPILLGGTMIIQTHLTPTPSVDNAQVKMMKFMPYMFALFCYNFSCALALYSTVNGIFTIGQQLVINRMRDDGDPTNPASAATKSPGGRPMKNVTPTKKK